MNSSTSPNEGLSEEQEKTTPEQVSMSAEQLPGETSETGEAPAPQVAQDVQVQNDEQPLGEQGAVVQPIVSEQQVAQLEQRVPTKKSKTVLIVALVMALLVVLIVLGTYVANAAVNKTAHQELQKDMASSFKVDPDDVNVHIDGSPAIVQLVTGKYEHINCMVTKPIVFDLDTNSLGGAASQGQPAIDHIVADFNNVNRKTMIAEHVSMSLDFNKELTKNMLLKSMESSAGGDMTIDNLELVDGGFILDATLELGVISGQMHIEANMSMNSNNEMIINITKTTVTALGETMDMTDELGSNTHKTYIGDLLGTNMRLTKFELSEKGLSCAAEGNNVNLSELQAPKSF